MKILSLNPYIPHPLNSGGNLRSHHIVAALVDEHDVTFASQWRCGEEVDDWTFARRFAAAPVLVPPGEPPSNTNSAALKAAIPHAWFGTPLSIKRHDFWSFWDALAALPLESYDVVQVRTFHLIPFALAIRARHPSVRLVLDLDDIPSVLRLRAVRSATTRWISRWRLRMYADFFRVRLYERRFLREFDAIWVCSELDRTKVGRWVSPDRVLCIPNGVDAAAYADVTPDPASRRLLFVADFRGTPNGSGIRWFRNEVFPAIRRSVPDAELWLVGRDPPPGVRELHAPETGVHVTGSVPSVVPYLARAAVSIVPVHVGAGTRLKIVEAMAAGLPVVSTTIGAEGIDCVDGSSIVLADTPEAMAAACISLLGDAARRNRIGDAGRRLAREHYDWSIVHQRIRECYASLAPGRAR